MSEGSVQGSDIEQIISSALAVDEDEFDDSTELGPQGLNVDSITMVEIVELLEMETGIEIEDQELDEFRGGTVRDLKDFVEERANSAA